MIWNFSLYIKDLHEFDDDLTNALYHDFSDGTLCVAKGRAKIGIGRESPSLAEAIRSAVASARAHGLEVDRVEIVEEDLTPAEIDQWQTV